MQQLQRHTNAVSGAVEDLDACGAADGDAFEPRYGHMMYGPEMDVLILDSQALARATPR